MKIYKDTNNNLYAYELDGSQDHIIPAEYIAITDAEADAIRASQMPEVVAQPEPTKAELLAQLQALSAKIESLGEA